MPENKKYLIEEKDLAELIKEIKDLKDIVSQIGGQELLFAKDVKEIMKWSDTTLWRRLNDPVHPLPMTKLGASLVITRDKFFKYINPPVGK